MPASEPPYSAVVEELFRHPRMAGTLPLKAGEVRIGEAGSVSHGAWVRFHLRTDGARVADARFQAYGCPHTLAAAEWAARQIVGRNAEEGLLFSAQDITAALAVPTEKLGKLLIVEDALRSALRGST